MNREWPIVHAGPSNQFKPYEYHAKKGKGTYAGFSLLYSGESSEDGSGNRRCFTFILPCCSAKLDGTLATCLNKLGHAFSVPLPPADEDVDWSYDMSLTFTQQKITLNIASKKLNQTIELDTSLLCAPVYTAEYMRYEWPIVFGSLGYSSQDYERGCPSIYNIRVENDPRKVHSILDGLTCDKQVCLEQAAAFVPPQATEDE